MPGPDCVIRQITSGSFAEALRASDGNPGVFPLSASMDLTTACNLRCRHCFLRHAHAKLKDMPTRDAEALLETLRDLGVLFLVITGGEPLSHSDFKSVYLKAKRAGFVVTLFSNGTLLDDEALDFLADVPPRRLELTIYGHTEPVYEAVTGVPGSFRRFRHGVEGLLRRGLLVRLKTMILRTNVHEAEAMRSWATGLGCDFRSDPIIHPRLNGDAAPLAERLAPEVVAELRQQDRRRRAAAGGAVAWPEELPPRRHLFECGAGTMTLHVDAQGQAHPCLSWREDPFDLARNPTAKAWRQHVDAIRNRPAPGGRCDTCRERSRCSCCPALAILETGKAAGAPTFFCQVVEEENRKMSVVT